MTGKSQAESRARSGGGPGAPVAPALPAIRSVEMDRPWAWLEAGWRDFVRAPGVSIAYGGFFTVVGYLLTYGLYAGDMLSLAMPLAAGFTLIGPLAAVGLYQVSRRLEQGNPVSIRIALRDIAAHIGTVSAMGLVLLLFLLAWIRLALLIFAIFFGGRPTNLQDFVGTVFFAPESLPFVVTGIAIGAVLAGVVFTISVVSLPMLLDRDVGVAAAIATSFNAVMQNIRAMALWAALIAVFTAAGLATLYVGLVICLPLIGYASWHAYRDVVAPEGEISGGG